MNNLIFAIAGLWTVGLICTTAIEFVPGEHSGTIKTIGAMVLFGSGFLIQHFKTQKVEEKLDANTALTAQTATKAEHTASKVEATAAEVTRAAEGAAATLYEKVNGRMDEWVATEKEAAYAAGMAAGEVAAKKVAEQLHRHHIANIENLASLKRGIEQLRCQQAEAKEKADKAERADTRDAAASTASMQMAGIAADAVKTAADAGSQVAEKVIEAAEAEARRADLERRE